MKVDFDEIDKHMKELSPSKTGGMRRNVSMEVKSPEGM